MSQATWQFQIQRKDIRQAALVEVDSGPLPEGQIELALKAFTITANNITYALLGNSFGDWEGDAGYFNFFPADDAAVGLLPVWGFAEVTESKHADIQVGEMIYGFFPYASHCRMLPGKVHPGGFSDLVDHRLKLPVVYNQYNRVAAMSDYREADNHLWPVFRPLLVTGYLLADQLSDNGYYQADQVLVASASSKTAMMFAHSHRRNPEAPPLVGLTSPRNEAFVKSVGLYDKVLTYDAVESLEAGTASAYVDMAGNGDLIRRVHTHFEDNLKASILVGKSHWHAKMDLSNLPGPQMAMFFAPGQIKKRGMDWGPSGLQKRLAEVWDAFVGIADQLVTTQHLNGPEVGGARYSAFLAGNTDPRSAEVIRL